MQGLTTKRSFLKHSDVVSSPKENELLQRRKKLYHQVAETLLQARHSVATVSAAELIVKYSITAEKKDKTLCIRGHVRKGQTWNQPIQWCILRASRNRFCA